MTGEQKIQLIISPFCQQPFQQIFLNALAIFYQLFDNFQEIPSLNRLERSEISDYC